MAENQEQNQNQSQDQSEIQDHFESQNQSENQIGDPIAKIENILENVIDNVAEIQLENQAQNQNQSENQIGDDYPYTFKLGKEMEVLMGTLEMNKSKFKILVPPETKFQLINDTDFLLHIDNEILSTGQWTLISEYIVDDEKTIWLWSWGMDKFASNQTQAFKEQVQEKLSKFKEMTEGKIVLTKDPLFVSFMMATLTDIFKFEYMHVLHMGQEGAKGHRFTLFGLKNLEWNKLRDRKKKIEKDLDNIDSETLDTPDTPETFETPETNSRDNLEPNLESNLEPSVEEMVATVD